MDSPDSKADLSIIIPLYNEENTILRVLELLEEVNFPHFIKDIEIIIVDDCSTDGSLKRVLTYAESNEKVSVLEHKSNMGKGASVRTGIKHAKGEQILIQDADLELNPHDIPRMLSEMKNLNVELVNGSRYLPGVTRPLASYNRYLANKFFTFLTSVLINVKLTDMACAYKLIKKDLLDQITLKENRFGFEAELIIKALRIKKNNIAEVPVQYFPRQASEGKKLKMTDGFKILWYITKYGLIKIK